ncbi:MAG: hypothetical protein SFV51_24525, partial [Bryobacteraceae bacterium]|nr:hypothetical protein [Bryobacteraceae bacterium]
SATGPGRLSVTLSSGVIEPLVIVVDEQDRPVAVNLAVAPGTLATTANLVRGNYRVLVSTLQNAGSFSLKTEFQASGIITPPIGEDEPEQTIEPSSWVMDALRRLQGAAVELERASSPKLRREE